MNEDTKNNEIKIEMEKIREIIINKHGKLKAFRDFPKGIGRLSFKGYVCPDIETRTLYKRFTELLSIVH